MADSDQSLQIILEILAKTQGADVVQAALDKTKAAAKDTGQAADYLNPAFANATKSMDKAAEGTKALELNHRLLHAAIHATGAEIPGLSALLHGLFNPASIGLVAGMAAIGLYFEHLKKVQEKQLEWTLSLQKTNDLLHDITASGKTADEQLIAINEALAQATVAAHGHAHEIEQMQEDWKRYEQAVTDAAAAEKEHLSDTSAATEAKIKILEKAGVITKQTAEDMRSLARYEAEVSKIRAEREIGRAHV